MNKQTLTFYVKKSNGVVTQVGHGYIRQQAQKKQNIIVSMESGRKQIK